MLRFLIFDAAIDVFSADDTLDADGAACRFLDG